MTDRRRRPGGPRRAGWATGTRRRFSGGPSCAFTGWRQTKGVAIRFIRPGKPDQNAFNERFNSTCRAEVLTPHLFDSIEDVREITGEWLAGHSEIRPHDTLESLPPAHHRERQLAAGSSTFALSG